MEADFQAKNARFCETSIKALICSGYLMPLMNVINNLCYVALAVFSGILFLHGNIRDIGLITSFLLYVRQFTRPFVEIANIYNNFQTAVAGAERVFEIMDEASEPEDRPGALDLENPRGNIVLNHVQFGYSPEKNRSEGYFGEDPRRNTGGHCRPHRFRKDHHHQSAHAFL